MSEFDWIARYFAPLTQHCQGAAMLQDDAMLLPALPAGQQWVTSTDMMAESVHFFVGYARLGCRQTSVAE